MKYPRKPKEKWESVKLTIKDIERIKQLYFIEGLGYRTLGKIFNVAANTIRYHVKSDYRQRKIKESMKYNQAYLKDPDYRRKAIKRYCEQIKKRKQEDPEFLKWVKAQRHYDPIYQKQWLVNHPEYQREYQREYRKRFRHT